MAGEEVRENAERVRVRKPELSRATVKAEDPACSLPGLASLQQRVGNRAVQRFLAQRSAANAPMLVDEQVAQRINRERGGGQTLDSSLQTLATEAMGHDLSGVRVHTSREADALSRDLSAQAFTTGRDIFFRAGAYDPHSAGGRELIAHELTHVVQQRSGIVGSSGGGMVVNPPDDAFEREADAVAGCLSGAAAITQRQQVPEEEEPVQTRALAQRQAGVEEEELQRQPVSAEEIEAALQGQKLRKGEEEEAGTPVQRQEVPEEEELV
jgi:hypothetical protein